ncbi:hypothetical protein [Hoylesella enoeca]|uniref:hypothetical protein n=1 Tax=Hoylesella enoeca TaxID=76123 RepID=UPI002889E113|nr:hypothetical protein [Hoylesella enoeca]
MKTNAFYLLALTVLLGLASCSGDELAQNDTKSNGSSPSAGNAIFESGEPGTRTSLTHTFGAGADVLWTAGDKIWVKDDGGTFHQSGAADFTAYPTDKSRAQFALNGTYAGTTYPVVYTGSAGTSATEVTIKKEQTQSAPNNSDHLGTSGDCGVATATGSAGKYGFKLAHKAAYLCLLPRSSNEYVNRSKLVKVEISADDNIAGTYNMAADGTLSFASDGSKTVTVTAGSGFQLDNAATDASKNAVYAVIAPGNRTLRIRYWLRNEADGIDAMGNPAPIEGTVTKYVTLNCEAGKIYDVTANLAPKNYPGNNYYMWDAQENCWSGYEWNHSNPANRQQPTVNSIGNSNYPQNSSDPRWFNPACSSLYVQNDAVTPLFQTLPNANEMSWYVMKGDPRRDTDELWTTFGRLYKGGMWFKKMSQIKIDAATEINAAGGDVKAKGIKNDGTYQDFRINLGEAHNTSSSTPFTVNEEANYFYLPFVGVYTHLPPSGRFMSPFTCCWTASADTGDNSEGAYMLRFFSNFDDVDMIRENRAMGALAVPFE